MATPATSPPSHTVSTISINPLLLNTVNVSPLPLLALLYSKPKNARVKRALDEREPKLVENEKTCIFVSGNKTSERIRDAMKDMVSRVAGAVKKVAPLPAAFSWLRSRQQTSFIWTLS